MYEICLNTLSVVSIDYSVFIFSYRFGLAVLFLCRDHKVPVQLCAYCVLLYVFLVDLVFLSLILPAGKRVLIIFEFTCVGLCHKGF